MSDLSGVETVANGDCAVVRFSTADYAPSERLEALHEVFGRSLQKVHVEALAGESFRTAVTLRRMPGLTLYKASRSAAISASIRGSESCSISGRTGFRIPRSSMIPTVIDGSGSFRSLSISSAILSRDRAMRSFARSVHASSAARSGLPAPKRA